MSAYYDLYQTPNPSPEDGEEKLLHARILPKGTIPADKFRELVHKATGFSSNAVNGHILYVDGGILAYIGKQPK